MVLAAAARMPPCDRCARGKATNYPQRPSTRDPAVASVLDPDPTGGPHNLRIDIMFTRSRSKAKTPCLVVTDEVTGHTNIVYLPTRSTKHVEAALLKTTSFLEKHGIKIGLIKSDREGAFVELNSKKYRFHLTAGPGTHEAVSEVVIRQLKDMFVCKREGLSFTLPRSLYPKLMEHVCVLYNHRLRPGATATPAEMVTGRNISAEDLVQGAFGRIALFHIPDEEAKRRKLDDLDPRAEYGVVIGFEPSNPRNLKVYLPVHKQIVTRRGGKPVGDPQLAIEAMNKLAAEEEARYSRSTHVSEENASTATSDDFNLTDNHDDGDFEDTDFIAEVHTVYGLYAKTEEPLHLPFIKSAQANVAARKTSSETRAIMLGPDHPKEYHVPVGAFERISLAKAKLCLPSELVDGAVIQELITNMQRYDVWDYCTPDSVRGKHVLRSMLFLKVKTTPTGEFDKLKARLVPDGSMQKEDEYSRTSSPTVDFSNLSLVLSLTKYLRAKISTVDVPAAYLNASIREQIYMRLDKGVADVLVANDPSLAQYRCQDGSIVVRLKKCIYGLKQSGAEWHDIIVKFLLSLGFEQSVADRCIFYKTIDGKPNLVAIHVDDLLQVYTDDAHFESVKTQFVKRFGEMKFTEGASHSYLGMALQVLPDNSVFVNQTGYARSLVASYEQWRATLAEPFHLRPYKTPSVPSLTELAPAETCDKDFKDKVVHYVYSLLYIVQHTRPDFMFPVNYLTTLVSSPPRAIIPHLDRVFGYLHGTLGKGLLLGAESTGLTMIADAAYAIHRDGKSHSGVIVKMGDSTIAAQSAKQKLVTMSSTEAELEAMVSGLKRLQPIRRLLEELDLLATDPTIVQQDNKSAITIASSGEGYSGKSKHMRVRYHAVAEQIANGEIAIEHCPTIKMLSDVLTKPGGGTNFTDLVDAIVALLPDA